MDFSRLYFCLRRPGGDYAMVATAYGAWRSFSFFLTIIPLVPSVSSCGNVANATSFLTTNCASSFRLTGRCKKFFPRKRVVAQWFQNGLKWANRLLPTNRIFSINFRLKKCFIKLFKIRTNIGVLSYVENCLPPTLIGKQIFQIHFFHLFYVRLLIPM